ncbi:MAG: biotin--[acetyl-CoA-carboxylase] ligase [Nannocystaceae bacterium]|nr:biotin--[acetyl-CoA-carboxylase] ligase [Myxococcales bacterium]
MPPSPESLPVALARRLATRALGRVHEHHAILDSTNERALSWALTGAVHGAMVTADAQSAGRGRLGREWSSPASDDLYVSLVVRPPWPRPPADVLAALGLAVAVGLREGLACWLPDLALKWPNDLLHQGRKLAGILCEARWQGEALSLVIGFGVNVSRRAFDPALAQATSLALAGAKATRVDVLAAVLASLEGVLDRYLDPRDPGFAAIRERYEPHCVTLEAQAPVLLRPPGGDAPVAAEVLGLDARGALRARPIAGGPAFTVVSVEP